MPDPYVPRTYRGVPVPASVREWWGQPGDVRADYWRMGVDAALDSDRGSHRD